MKLRRHGAKVWAAGLALLALAGCVSQRQMLALDPVGPSQPGFGLSTQGYLQVYSLTERNERGDLLWYPHTGYSVYSSEGRKVKSVVNHVGLNDNRPMTVTLPEGRYVVFAQAEGFGMVKVPVLIVSGRLTMVNLERKGVPELEGLPEKDAVRLPGAYIVGPRAASPETRERPPASDAK